MTDPDLLPITLRPLDTLIPYVRNARRHEPWQIDMIAASVQEFGWTNPVLVAGDGILAGHGRVLAAQKLGIKRVPCIDLSHLSEVQRRAYVLADNRLAEKGTSWDIDLLRVETDALLADGFDLELTGFSTDELAELFAQAELPSREKDPDEAPDPPEVAHSVPGDMWVCGPHRVRCGSATLIDDWQALMQGEAADLQVCDPPYNVAYESELAGMIKNDDLSAEDFRRFLREFYVCSFAVLKPGAAMYVAHSDSEGIAFRQEFVRAGFKLSSCLTWKKNNMVLGRLDYQSIAEPILYGWKPGSRHKWYGGRKNVSVHEVGEYPPFERLDDGRYAVRHGDQLLIVPASAQLEQLPTSMLYHDKPRRSALHPTMKPVGLWERLMRNSARPGDVVVDGFGGSGTTMIAADGLGMSARLMEIDPKFVDVVVRRWQNLTGRRAVHAETGAEFPAAPEA